MKKILYTTIVVMITIIAYASSPKDPIISDPRDIVVRDVEIVDSQLMDQILLHVTSDSVREIFKRYFSEYIDFSEVNDFSEYQNWPNGIIIYTGKRIYHESVVDLPTIDDIIEDELREVVMNDTLNKVVIRFSTYISPEYKTQYLGKVFYFSENCSIDNKPIFNLKPTQKTITIDDDEYFLHIYEGPWIPLIYHNGRLFIDPAKVQWYATTE